MNTSEGTMDWVDVNIRKFCFLLFLALSSPFPDCKSLFFSRDVLVNTTITWTYDLKTIPSELRSVYLDTSPVTVTPLSLTNHPTSIVCTVLSTGNPVCSSTACDVTQNIEFVLRWPSSGSVPEDITARFSLNLGLYTCGRIDWQTTCNPGSFSIDNDSPYPFPITIMGSPPLDKDPNDDPNNTPIAQIVQIDGPYRVVDDVPSIAPILYAGDRILFYAKFVPPFLSFHSFLSFLSFSSTRNYS